MKKMWKITAVICLSFMPLTGVKAASKEKFAVRYENARLTTLAAQACAGTYVPNGEAREFSYLEHYGFTITPYEETIDGVKLNFVVATNPQHYGGKRLSVLAVRGSADKNDWQINLKTQQVPFGLQGKATARKNEEQSKVPQVHQGFDSYVQAALKCRADIDGDGKKDQVVEKLKSEPDLVLLLAGHSLGGAVASLYGEYLVQQGVPKEQIPVITFGAPAVGNAEFAKVYGDKINLRRIVTSYDPVPGSLQSFFGGYKQFGELEKFSLDGTYADFQHPVSFYFDLALKRYYSLVDQGIEDGFLQPPPQVKKEGSGPLVALALTAKNTTEDERFVPDTRRFVLEEYLSLLPRYAIVNGNIKPNDENLRFEELLAAAQAQEAKYLIVLDVDLERIKQTDKRYVSVNQAIFTVPEGTLVAIYSGNTRVTFNQGVAQATIGLIEKSRQEIKKNLTFTKVDQVPSWREIH